MQLQSVVMGEKRKCEFLQNSIGNSLNDLFYGVVFCFQQAFSQYLAYRRDNNELLLFVLQQLTKEQIIFFRSRYRSEPDVIEIQEDEFTDRVSYNKTNATVFFSCSAFKMAGRELPKCFKNPGGFSPVKHDAVSSFRLNNGSRLPENKHGCQLLEITS